MDFLFGNFCVSKRLSNQKLPFSLLSFVQTIAFLWRFVVQLPMQICTVVKLHTTPEQHAALAQTLRMCNDACDCISQVAFKTGTFRQYDLHHACYYNVKAETNLHANHSTIGHFCNSNTSCTTKQNAPGLR